MATKADVDRYDRTYPGACDNYDEKAERVDRRAAMARRRSGHSMRMVVPETFDGFTDAGDGCEWIEIAPGKFRRVAKPKEG